MTTIELDQLAAVTGGLKKAPANNNMGELMDIWQDGGAVLRRIGKLKKK